MKDYSFSRVHFSSLTGEWSTPRSLFDQLDTEFHFTLDVCANSDNAKCEKFFSPEDNALFQKWRGVCWLNPPYGREVGRWLGKAVDAARNGATVVCLLPARTDTKWFHEYCTLSNDIRFIRGRLYFTNRSKAGPAPFPSMIVVFRGPAGVIAKERLSQEVLF